MHSIVKPPDSPRSSHSTSSSSTPDISESLGLLSEKKQPRFRRLPRIRSICYVLILVCFGILFANIAWHLLFSPVQGAPPGRLYEDLVHDTTDSQLRTTFQKPDGLRVVGLVFYSSRRKLSILECYLQRNLVENGGMLDGVIFIPETGTEKDLDWLRLLADSQPSYKMLGKRNHWSFFKEEQYFPEDPSQAYGWNAAWEAVQDGTLYIHVSSEIVFMDQMTIPSMIETRLKYRNYLVISANIVNQPTLSWIHHHLGVIDRYRPEMKPLVRSHNGSIAPRYDWRASDLPTWNGPEDFGVPVNFGIPTDFQPPFNGHRWLPVRNNKASLNPLTHETLDMNGAGKWSWTTGALHHYNFLQHLEKNELHRYQFPLWDFQHEVLYPSMIAMWGEDITDLKPMPDSYPEKWLSREVPRRSGGICMCQRTTCCERYADIVTQILL